MVCSSPAIQLFILPFFWHLLIYLCVSLWILSKPCQFGVTRSVSAMKYPAHEPCCWSMAIDRPPFFFLLGGDCCGFLTSTFDCFSMYLFLCVRRGWGVWRGMNNVFQTVLGVYNISKRWCEFDRGDRLAAGVRVTHKGGTWGRIGAGVEGKKVHQLENSMERAHRWRHDVGAV